MKQTTSASYYAEKLKIWLEIGASDEGIYYLNFTQTGASESQDVSNEVIRYALIQLDKYFSCDLVTFDLPLDFSGWSEFQKKVWRSLLKIPFGQSRSYSEIAIDIGHPKACRAVGNANSKNPVPIIVPCHRVIRSDGSLGGYSSGVDLKRLLMLHELACNQRQRD